MTESDKRRYPRYEVDPALSIAWRSPSISTVTRVNNVGLGGLFIQTQQPQPAGTMLQILLQSPAGDVRARAIVRAVHPSRGMGVEFIAMRPEDRGRLNQTLRKVAGPAAN